jgi:hypothetical protein
MPEQVFHYFLRYGTIAISIIIAAMVILPYRSKRPWWAWPLAVLLGLAFTARIAYDFHITENWGNAFEVWWDAGAHSLGGKDPYTIKGLPPPHQNELAFYSPPYMIPFCRLIALAPKAVAVTIWAVVNLVICMVLGLAARRALLAQDGEQSRIVEPWVSVLLTAPIVLSQSGRLAMEDGQLSLLTTLWILGALWAQGTKPANPVAAGACLALASFKPQTLVPFLIVFLRWCDRRIWVCFGLFIGLLLLCAGNPSELPERAGSFLSMLRGVRQPGSINDASMLNNFSFTGIGVDHALWRIGVGGPALVHALNYLAIAAGGGWLVYLAIGKTKIPRGALCSLVSLYSMLFLYHRLYDQVIFIIPMIYCASRLRASSGPAWWCYAWVLTAILLALNAPYGEFYRIQHSYTSHPVLTVLFLPSVTYFILSAIAALAVAVRLEHRRGLTAPSLACYANAGSAPALAG